VPDHALDQFDQGRGRRRLAEQMRQIGVGLAFFRQNFRIKRGLGREVLEQQPLPKWQRRPPHSWSCAGKAVAGKAPLGGAQYQLTP